VYPGGKFAVRGLTLGIPKGECFGLLGINGAGKTTTLSILTGEFPPSEGGAYLGGFDILENPEVVRRLVGYCPQFDSLVSPAVVSSGGARSVCVFLRRGLCLALCPQFDLLTGREHLELYARVKGIPEEHLQAVVNSKIKEMDLIEYADRNASTYRCPSSST
jgi:ATP-binding cassette, subfamily A (ABC1), member 3